MWDDTCNITQLCCNLYLSLSVPSPPNNTVMFSRALRKVKQPNKSFKETFQFPTTSLAATRRKGALNSAGRDTLAERLLGLMSCPTSNTSCLFVLFRNVSPHRPLKRSQPSVWFYLVETSEVHKEKMPTLEAIGHI